jgi:hypothetical protein
MVDYSNHWNRNAAVYISYLTGSGSTKLIFLQDPGRAYWQYSLGIGPGPGKDDFGNNKKQL